MIRLLLAIGWRLTFVACVMYGVFGSWWPVLAGTVVGLLAFLLVQARERQEHHTMSAAEAQLVLDAQAALDEVRTKASH